MILDNLFEVLLKYLDNRSPNALAHEEINYANTIFEVLECPVINVDNRSIAEIAMLIQEKN